MTPKRLLLVAALLPLAGTARSAEPLEGFELHPDFEMTLAAREPAVFDPVDIEFDEHGQLFVMEMPGYPFSESQSRIVLLEDRDGDGEYESRTVYADDLGQADSLLPYRGGFLAASPPELIFVQDTDGDGLADKRETLLTGFAADNPQHNFNGLSYGLDNWIYGANGDNGGLVQWPDRPDEKTSIRSDDFRVDLRGRRFEAVGHTCGGFGITFDAYGRQYGTHNLYPMNQLVFPERFVQGVPMPGEGALQTVIDDAENDLTRIYPIGLQETRVNHPEQSGYFSGSCGITHYGGGALGPEADGNLFVCDVVLNLIHRRRLEADGSAFLARRIRPGVEFLASSDRAFRPVNMAVAPDGALWIADMHRDVIEHPEWIPDEIEATLDLNAGKAQGRLYRITRKGAPLHEAPSFNRDYLDYAVAALGHPNQWFRLTAQRLLVDWNDPAAVPLLLEALDSDDVLGRLHATWTLDGLGALENDLLLARLEDADAGVRENALIIAADRLPGAKTLRAAVLARANDESPRVRLFAALAMGRLAPDDDGALDTAIMAVAKQDLGDRWTRLALLPAISHAPEPVLAELLHGALSGLDDREPLVGLIGQMVGQQAEPGAMVQMVERLADASEPGAEPVLIALLDGLSSGIEGRPGRRWKDMLSAEDAAFFSQRAYTESLPAILALWRFRSALRVPAPEDAAAVLAKAKAFATDDTSVPEERVIALRLWAYADFPAREDALFALLDTRVPHDVQLEAMRQLSDHGGQDVAQRLIEHWRGLGPAVRGRATDFLLDVMPNHPLLMSALEDGRIKLGEMNLHLERRRTLLHSPMPGVSARAEALFSDAGIVTRKEAIARMQPALELQGDAAKGRAIFEERCSKCHRVRDLGGELAPNLTEIFRKSKETILHDVLDPNAAVDMKYVAYTVATTDLESYTGIIEQESEAGVVLRDANNETHSIPRDSIESMTSAGLSLMPEELEAGLEPQHFADLLEFLRTPE
ncbi:MAG: c-type cytochrome [Candidatus Hydrogenedens sp.]|nr:c-type cytochrome [Candidatus Hydrogenedens sp.]